MLDKKQFPWEQEGFAELRAWIAANPIAGSSPACSSPEAIDEATATEILVSREPDRRSACEVGFSVSSPPQCGQDRQVAENPVLRELHVNAVRQLSDMPTLRPSGKGSIV